MQRCFKLPLLVIYRFRWRRLTPSQRQPLLPNIISNSAHIAIRVSRVRKKQASDVSDHTQTHKRICVHRLACSYVYVYGMFVVPSAAQHSILARSSQSHCGTRPMRS